MILAINREDIGGMHSFFFGTSIGWFFVSIIILIAKWEREAISERTIRTLDQSAYEGNYVHG